MDLILSAFDTYLLDSVWAFLLPATPSSSRSLLRHSPALLQHFATDAQTQQRLLLAADFSSSGGGGGGAALRDSAKLAAVAGARSASRWWPSSASASSAAASLSASSLASKATASLLAAFNSSSSLSQAAAGRGAGAGRVASTAGAALDVLDWHKVQGLSALTRDNLFRQCVSLYAITYVGILVLYFLFAGLSYRFVFNKAMLKHPRFLKNQVSLEIASSLAAFPVLDALTLPWFVGEVRGHSQLYHAISDGPFARTAWGLGGWTYALFSIPFFLVFTDFCIYWVHRLEHHPRLYKHIHKPHHKWLVPTPFASHAFHPLDGYAQSVPYHIFVYLFPLHRMVYMGLFVFVNLWAILIHDSDMICNSPLEKIINGPSHHTLHHLYFNVNYGQYFTGCDRLGGSYRAPKMEDDPLNDVGHHHKGDNSAAASNSNSNSSSKLEGKKNK